MPAHKIGAAADEILMPDHGFGVAAVGHRLVMPINAVIRADHAGIAVLLQTTLTGLAATAGIDNTAHAHLITHAVLADLIADRRDAPDDLVPRHHGVHRAAPVVLGEMDIGVAYAAIVDLDGHVVRPECTAFDVVRMHTGGFGLSGIGFD